MKISELKTAILLERYEDVAEALKKYKDRDDIFISYSNVPKLGISRIEIRDTSYENN